MSHSRISIINRDLVGSYLEPATIGEFKISTTNRLPHFDTGLAQAYALEKDPGMYALVFLHTDCIRLHELIELKDSKIHGLEVPEAYGITNLGEREYFIMVMPRPSSISMYERIIVNDFSYSIIQSWLLEIFDILHILHSQGIMHGSLNGSSIRISKDDHILLSSCLANQCGAEQIDIFETIPRSRCHSYGKSVSDIKADYYAIGVLLLELIAGKQFPYLNKIDIIYEKMNQGSFNYLYKIIGININDLDINYKKLLYVANRLLQDLAENRWEWLQVIEFLNSTKSESEIAQLLETYFSDQVEEDHEILKDFIVFNNKKYDNIAVLSTALERSWDEAQSLLRSGKIIRWLLQAHQLENSSISAYNKMYLESNKYAIHDYASVISRDDAMLAYIIATFTHQDIISFKGLTFHLSALGSMLKYAKLTNQDEIITNILALLQSKLLANIVIFAHFSSNYINKAYQLIQNSNDIRYIVYALNPELSHLLFNHYICFCPKDVISVLETHTEIDNLDHIPIMQDLLLFLLARLHLEALPDSNLPQGLHKLQNERLFTLLRLLAIGQGKLRSYRTSDLFAKALLQLALPLLHGTKAQDRLINTLDNVSVKGSLSALLRTLNHRLIKNDYPKYQAALSEMNQVVQERYALISWLNDNQIIRRQSHAIAIKFAAFICVCTIIFFISQIMY